MARSRSRSPARTRTDRYRGVDRDSDRYRPRKERQRSRSPYDRRRRPPPPPPTNRGDRSPRGTQQAPRDTRPAYRPLREDKDERPGRDDAKSKVQSTEQDEADEDGMAAMMGFAGFGSTKGEKVKGNEGGAVAKPPKKVEYRQYMNRPGGFNRPLDN